MNKNTALNFLLTLIFLTINIFITKWTLNTLGDIWEVETFANMNWKVYWAFSSIAGIYVLSRAVELTVLKNSVDEIRDKSKSWNDYETTYRQLVYTISIFLVLFFSWFVNIVFF